VPVYDTVESRFCPVSPFQPFSERVFVPTWHSIPSHSPEDLLLKLPLHLGGGRPSVGMLPWLYRCAPALSGFALIGLVLLAFRPSRPAVNVSGTAGDHSAWEGCSSSVLSFACAKSLRFSQMLFIFYYSYAHLSMFLFVPQLSIAIWQTTKGLAAVGKKRRFGDSSSSSSMVYSDSGYSSDLSDEISSNGYPRSPSSITKADLPLEDRILHAIIVPNYMEELDTLRETLGVFAAHDRARYQYDVSWLLTFHYPG
jgi:hypothetical protein